MAGGILPSIYGPGGMAALQARLLAAAQGTDNSVRACPQLDTATRAAWGDFYISVVDFSQQDPGFFFGSLVDQAQALEQQLQDWQKKIGQSCGLSVPIYNPTNDPNAPSNLTTIVKYVSVAAIVVAAAYGVAKLVEVVEVAAPSKRVAAAKNPHRLRGRAA